MSTLFRDILRRRNEIEQAELVRQRNLYQQLYRQERSRRDRVEARKLLDVETMKVLEAFCRSAYPSMSIRTYEQGWSLGRWVNAADKSRAWESIVDITLRYDNQDRPVSYDCRGHNRHLVASVTPAALRQTMMRIHRPQHAGAAAASIRPKR